MSVKQHQTGLSLGPVLFNWPAEAWRDFYFRMADEAPLDTVYLGEVVCSKRSPFYAPEIPDVIERLERAGKKVVLSSLALVMKKREVAAIAELAADGERLVEANDMSALHHLGQGPHVIGPYINVYNEATLAHLKAQGAVRVCLPFELPEPAIAILAAAFVNGPELEVQVFGRTPLALSARCYHARVHNMSKDNCQFICAEDLDGLETATLDGQTFLAINGIQTLSHVCLDRLSRLADLQAMGVDHVRLSPQSCDMVRVANAYRRVLDKQWEPEDAEEELAGLLPGIPRTSSFQIGTGGMADPA